MTQLARTVMVLGCTSGAGKSWLTTALCRFYARNGIRVAPFKAQNMSNHARVVSRPLGGMGEIGSAQYFQARAAKASADVRMNPILLKPEADTHSQVVVMGRVDQELTAMPWRERASRLWEKSLHALNELRREYELLIIEGAGSPAEINLADVDYVNTATAVAAEAACLLVANIDHGGAFAHLYGTAELMDQRVRQQLRGFVLNCFRGDAALLAPGPQLLEARTQIPVLGVIPMIRNHGLPEEDAPPQSIYTGTSQLIAVIVTPHASNLDEFEPLRLAGLNVVFTQDIQQLCQAEWIILPGSKQTGADLRWLYATGLAAVIQAHVNAGRSLLAICGGLQMCGRRLFDPMGLEGSETGELTGLGLLNLETRFHSQKLLGQTKAQFGVLTGAFAPLSQLRVTGYEIHVGQTQALSDTSADLIEALVDGEQRVLGWQNGSVLAVYVHGLFENAEVLTRLFGQQARDLECSFDAMASVVERSFGKATLMALLNDR